MAISKKVSLESFIVFKRVGEKGILDDGIKNASDIFKLFFVIKVFAQRFSKAMYFLL